MIEWLKVQGLKIWAVVATILLAGSVVLVLKNGVHITSNSTSNSQSISNSYAYAGSMSIGFIGGDYRGKWEIKQSEPMHIDKVGSFLSSIDPIQFLNAKLIKGENFNSVIVFYPVIADLKDTKTTDSGVKTEKSSKVIK